MTEHDGAATLIARVKNILLKPGEEWERIDAEPTTIGDICRRYVLPLAAVPAIAGLIGALAFGYSAFGFSYRPSVGAALTSAIVQYGMALISVFVLMLIIDALAPSFQATPDRTRAFKVAAYSYTASWVAGILGILPALATLGALLGLYSFYLLYRGLPKLMRAPAEKALSYTVVVVIAAIVVALAIGAVTVPVTGALMGVF